MIQVASENKVNSTYTRTASVRSKRPAKKHSLLSTKSNVKVYKYIYIYDILSPHIYARNFLDNIYLPHKIPRAHYLVL